MKIKDFIDLHKTVIYGLENDTVDRTKEIDKWLNTEITILEVKE